MLRAFAVKVQPRIHREAAKSAKEREDFAMKNPFPPKFFWFRFFLRSETSDTIPER